MLVAGNPNFSKAEKLPSAKDIIPPKELHEARIIRDAEMAVPGIVRRTVDAAIAAGEEPSKAKVRRAVLETARSSIHSAPRSGARSRRNPRTGSRCHCNSLWPSTRT
jgi:hypothetical protein